VEDEQYAKLYRSITTSTVWMQPDHVRLVWITLLAHKDKNGNVFASLPGLAHVARVSLENTIDAVRVLSEPDPYSRTPDHEGRRIETIDGGWRVLNHSEYRNRRDMQDRREYERTRKAAQRAGHKDGSPGQSGTGPESPGMSAHTDTDTDLRKDKEARKRAFPADADEEGWKKLGVHYGVTPNVGEEMNKFKSRVRRAAHGRGKVPA